MKLNKIVIIIAMWVTMVQAADKIPAFPGAEGFGAFTPGGRGGQVLFVNNLNDGGPGSFRAACEAKGPRIIVFRVAGIIDLLSPVIVFEPFITIAGQTAPGDGICLRGYGLRVDTHDVIIRFLRCRAGDNLVSERDDALSIGGNSQNVIIDHCSVSWGTDETLSTSGRTSDLTVQWCIISEALHYSIHHEGPHGMGTLGRAIGGVTFHHNLWAHNNQRNPRLGDAYNEPPAPTFDVRNNVMYNYGQYCNGLNSGEYTVNFIANYIKPGPDSDRKNKPVVLRKDTRADYYIVDNVVEGFPELTEDNRKMLEPQIVNEIANQNYIPARKNVADLVTFVDSPIDVPAVKTTSALNAYHDVLTKVGATAPVRDLVDERIIKEVRSGAGSIIDSQFQVGGWPEYRYGRPERDSDRDGMPDEWEKAKGLNPLDEADTVKDRDADGYTNIEEYINSLAEPFM